MTNRNKCAFNVFNTKTNSDTIILFFCNRFLARVDTMQLFMDDYLPVLTTYCGNILNTNFPRAEKSVHWHAHCLLTELKWNKEIDLLKDLKSTPTHISRLSKTFLITVCMQVCQHMIVHLRPLQSRTFCSDNEILCVLAINTSGKLEKVQIGLLLWSLQWIYFSSVCSRVPIIFHVWKKVEKVVKKKNIY